jgi:hypothetical protein
MNAKEIKPKRIGTIRPNALEIKNLAQPLLPQIKVFIIILALEAQRKIIEACRANNRLGRVQYCEGDEGTLEEGQDGRVVVEQV